MPGERQTPTVRLRRLAAELRSLRTSSGLTRDEIVERTGINVATLYRIEHARVRPQTRTLRTLLDLYGVEGAHQDELIALLRDARQRGWLHAYQSVLPEQYTTYIGFEGGGARRLELRVAVRARPGADRGLRLFDTMAGELFLEEESDVRRYKLVFDHLRAVAESPDASRSLTGLVAQM
jgi:Predicted transcriptional regulator with C-terminal CBS domains